MRTSSLSYGRVLAHVVGNVTNIVIAGFLIAGFLTMRERMAWRWEHHGDSLTTIRQIIESSDQSGALEVRVSYPGTANFTQRLVRDEPSVGTGGTSQEELALATALYYEARSEPVLGQIEIAKVILNRRDDPRWPKTVKAVVAEGEEKRNACQFSFMCDGKPEHPEDEKSWRRALTIAKKVYTAWQRGDDFGCVHSYRADYTTSQKALKWFATLHPDKKIGRHIFYCDKRS